MTGLLADFALSDSGFIFDPRSGATFTVNVTGLAVLQALRAGKEQRAIAGLLREQFADVRDDVKDHVDDFVRSLRQLGLAQRQPEKP
jgi:PqqD family protein of HPr-rel-A system